MMSIYRRRQVKGRLQEAVQMRGGFQVFAAYYMRDVLSGVINHRGEVVAGARVLPSQDDIAENFRRRLKFARRPVTIVNKGKRFPRRNLRDRRLHRKPPGEGSTFRDQCAFLSRAQDIADISWAFRSVGAQMGRAGDFIENFLAGLEATINETTRTQRFNRRHVTFHMVRLAKDRLGPSKVQPG